MRSVVRQPSSRAGFTIIELLTVMSVIIILIGLLVPALNMVKRVAYKVNQKNQFHAIEVALETFSAEWDGYPDSAGYDEAARIPLSYGGAQKLAEAMVGQDLLGFHPEADFTWPNDIYSSGDLSGRRLYLKPESANAYRLRGFYSGTRLRPFDGGQLVLCDTYKRNWTYNNPELASDPMNGKPIGMPILYYRANTSGTTHPSYRKDLTTGDWVAVNGVGVDEESNIYDYRDNHTLVSLGKPWVAGWPTNPEARHDMVNPAVFYGKTWNDKIDIDAGRPYNTDTYILISAGFDGAYGNDDDVFNFGL